DGYGSQGDGGENGACAAPRAKGSGVVKHAGRLSLVACRPTEGVRLDTERVLKKKKPLMPRKDSRARNQSPARSGCTGDGQGSARACAASGVRTPTGNRDRRGTLAPTPSSAARCAIRLSPRATPAAAGA